MGGTASPAAHKFLCHKLIPTLFTTLTKWLSNSNTTLIWRGKGNVKRIHSNRAPCVQKSLCNWAACLDGEISISVSPLACRTEQEIRTSELLADVESVRDKPGTTPLPCRDERFVGRYVLTTYIPSLRHTHTSRIPILRYAVVLRLVVVYTTPFVSPGNIAEWVGNWKITWLECSTNLVAAKSPRRLPGGIESEDDKYLSLPAGLLANALSNIRIDPTCSAPLNTTKWMKIHGATWQVRSTTGVFYSVVLSRHDDDTHSINCTVQNLCHWVPSPCPHPLLAVAPPAGCHLPVENTTEHNTRCSKRKTVHPNRKTGTHLHRFPPIKRSLQHKRGLSVNGSSWRQTFRFVTVYKNR